MGLPPPKLRDLICLKEANSSGTKKHYVWEIGVPPTNSLYWSIVLSYLLAIDDNQFETFIEDLKRNESTGRKKKSKSLSPGVHFRDVKKKLHNFNPFKNRHVYFRNSEILESFKLKLNQYGNSLRTKTDMWNDDFKLSAASRMLNCAIQVYIPDENETRLISCPGQPNPHLPTLTLFQYLNQRHGSRKETINVFHFAMTVQHVYPLKLQALSHFLKKAEFTPEHVADVKRVMDAIEEHGEDFLSKILQSPHFEILPRLYKSPYIALKVSQAGFETNPAATQPNKQSAFVFAAVKMDTKYLRILYDYAANCRYHFEETVRDPGAIILDSLNTIKDILTNDLAGMDSCWNWKTADKNRIANTIIQFSRFNEYQINIANLTIRLKEKLDFGNVGAKNKLGSKSVLDVRKEFIQGILSSYIDFFYFDSQQSDLLENFHNYLKFTDYYENIDAFSCLSFFDSVYRLKKIFQLKNEDIFSGTESHFFLLIVSSRYFPQVMRDGQSLSGHNETEIENDESLRLIPLLYREDLKEEISKFSSKLNAYDESDPQLVKVIKEETLTKCLSSFPEIRDELLVSRIRNYLNAAIDISFADDGIKGILTVERALQVLGESIKPQSTKGCVVSSLLGSRLPINLREELKKIRNDFSKFRNNSAQGRLEIESDVELFKKLQLELQNVLTSFEAVAFTQYLRFETFLVKNGREKIYQQQLDQDSLQKFLHACEKKLENKVRVSERHHGECIQLSLDSIKYLVEFIHFKDLSNGKNQTSFSITTQVTAILESIEYILKFVSRNINEKKFQPYLKEVECFSQEYRNSKNIACLLSSITTFQETYSHDINANFNIGHNSNSFPILLSLFKSLKQNDISAEDVVNIVKTAKDSYSVAMKAKDELITYADNQGTGLPDKVVKIMINQLLISGRSLSNLKNHLNSKNWKGALYELKKKSINERALEKNIKDAFENDSSLDDIVKNLLIKIVYQRNLKTNIYATVRLSDDLCDKLEKFFSNKVTILLSRIEYMRSVLIEEDEEIESTWIWGRSSEIKHHLRFLMRQRFLREWPVRAALEMAFFDCLNILKSNEFEEIYEKVNNLFAGINLRNVLSHGNNVLETIGGLLDEDDLASELINKILELINDHDAITSIRDLMPRANTLEMEAFKQWMVTNADNADAYLRVKIKKVIKCDISHSYLSLFPLI